MQHNRRGGGEWPACYGRSGINLPRPILIFVAAKKNGPPAAAVAATISAADSNFCCCDGRLHPILIFVAAKKVVPPAASVATIIFHVRFKSSMRQRKMVPPADRSNTELQRFLISGGGNLAIAARKPLTCPDLGLQSESR